MGTMPQADAFIPYHVPVPNRRPTSVLVLGILGIILGSFGLLGAVAEIVMWVVMRGFMSRTLTVGRPTGVVDLWQPVEGIVSLSFAALLLWASIAAIRMRPWARVGLLRWAGAYLGWLVVATAVALVWVLPATLNFMVSVGPNGQPAPVPPSEGLMMYGVLVVSVVLDAVYPVVLIIFMRRPVVSEAFERARGFLVPVAALAPAEAARGAAPDFAAHPAEPVPLPPPPTRQEP